MTIRSKTQALCVATGIALMTLSTVPTVATAQSQAQSARDRDSMNRPQGETGQRNSRAAQERRGRGNTRQPVAPSPEVITAEAQTILATSSIPCQVTNAALHGETPQKQKLYEVACANDFGYLLLTGVEGIPGTNISCIEIAATQARVRAENPEAELGPKCSLPGNEEFLPVLVSMASEAGIACTVNEGNIIGRKGDAAVYEIGCDGVDGARINRKDAGWEVDPCIILAAGNVTCNYTTKDEQIATVKAWFAGSEAAPCDVADLRYMGANANGTFYEAKCNGADGIIARLDNAKAVQQVYPCAEAAQVGGGCKLTDGSPQS